MKRVTTILFYLIFSSLGMSQSLGKICDIDGTCVFELKPKEQYKTQNGQYLENQLKEQTKKQTPCEVRAWINGPKNKKEYQIFTTNISPIEIIRKSTGSRIVKFQYVEPYQDAAVEAFNDVIFVDHAFTVYLVMPDHNCHGLPTSPTIYHTCLLCGNKYKSQEFYNNFTEKYINIYNSAGPCKSKYSTTGNCDNLILSPVPACPKFDTPDCDQLIKGGTSKT